MVIPGGPLSVKPAGSVQKIKIKIKIEKERKKEKGERRTLGESP